MYELQSVSSNAFQHQLPVTTCSSVTPNIFTRFVAIIRNIWLYLVRLRGKGKGKEEYLYSAFSHQGTYKRSGMDHTVLPANNTTPAFPSWRSPDVTTTATEAADIQLQLTTLLTLPP